MQCIDTPTKYCTTIIISEILIVSHKLQNLVHVNISGYNGTDGAIYEFLVVIT